MTTRASTNPTRRRGGTGTTVPQRPPRLPPDDPLMKYRPLIRLGRRVDLDRGRMDQLFASPSLRITNFQDFMNAGMSQFENAVTTARASHPGQAPFEYEVRFEGADLSKIKIMQGVFRYATNEYDLTNPKDHLDPGKIPKDVIRRYRNRVFNPDDDRTYMSHNPDAAERRQWQKATTPRTSEFTKLLSSP